ncbi:helix-turn-helix transcriptional regulator [Leptospira sp. 201903074]|uniref:helix-turn-helix domain-containing protein n=1 Tax=Leptospira abararensis TaxID=2810036 RepID=UPI001965FD2D|nr:helix-turn-helix transcriptional regulator [Leptospira abararensis]
MGNRFRELIKSLSLTQKDFAIRIGVSQGFVSEIINGKNLPSQETLTKISKEFNVNLDWLLAGEGQMFRPTTAEIHNSISKLEELRAQHFQTKVDPVLAEAIEGIRELAKSDQVGLEIVRNLVKKLLGKE